MSPFHKPFRRFQNPTISINESYFGLYSALIAEKRFTKAIETTIGQIRKTTIENVYEIKPSSNNVINILDSFEAWTVRNNQKTWQGVVVNTNTEDEVMFVELRYMESDPRVDEFIFLEEPDYHILLRQWVENMANSDAPLPETYKLLSNHPQKNSTGFSNVSKIESMDGTLREDQLKAIELTNRRVGVVWGPPGTGKTYTLGSMVAHFLRTNKKVLAIAPTNIAADQMALAVDNAAQRLDLQLENGVIIRAGFPVLQELNERHHLMKWNGILKNFSEQIQDVYKQISFLERLKINIEKKAKKANDLSDLILQLADKEEIGSSKNLQITDELLKFISQASEKQDNDFAGNLIEFIRDKITSLKIAIKSLEECRSRELWECAGRASCIITTLLSAFYNKQIFEQKIDVLFLDESSMISKGFILPFLDDPEIQVMVAGDFRQLGPIVKNKNQNDKNAQFWLKESIFELLNVSSSEGVLSEAMQYGSLIMLESQSRMQSEICAPLSNLFYRGRLKTIGASQTPPRLPLWSQRGIVVFDPYDVGLPPGSPSGVAPDFNKELHGFTSDWSLYVSWGIVKFLLKYMKNPSILLITPFRLQANNLRKLVRAYFSSEKKIRAGTIHTAQGSEADFVILDLVNPLSPWLLSTFGDADEISRLYCVAFSRAKTQLFVYSSLVSLERNRFVSKLCEDSEKNWTPDWRILLDTK